MMIALNPDEWGKGLGKEALALLLRYAFNELNMHRVQLTVFDHNERALKLYRALGFRHEGVFREFLEREGQRHDMLLMGLLAREWENGENMEDEDEEEEPQPEG